MFSISKRFDFSAAHQLRGLPETHQCARPHGHNYSVTVSLSGDELDEVGFIVDYGRLDQIKQFLDATVEHRDLNEVFDFNPTAENLAKHFYGIFKAMFPQVMSVEVKETDKTKAMYMAMEDPNKLMVELSTIMNQIRSELAGATKA
jgi:6-pyruvoyltetrahydropterin/6-carboxytetrahydropterin synthase